MFDICNTEECQCQYCIAKRYEYCKLDEAIYSANLLFVLLLPVICVIALCLIKFFAYTGVISKSFWWYTLTITILILSLPFRQLWISSYKNGSLIIRPVPYNEQ